MTNPTAPPRHLSPESKKLWRSVLADCELEKRHEAILCTALQAHDRMRQAQAAIAEEGLTTVFLPLRSHSGRLTRVQRRRHGRPGIVSRLAMDDEPDTEDHALRGRGF